MASLSLFIISSGTICKHFNCSSSPGILLFLFTMIASSNVGCSHNIHGSKLYTIENGVLLVMLLMLLLYENSTNCSRFAQLSCLSDANIQRYVLRVWFCLLVWPSNCRWNLALKHHLSFNTVHSSPHFLLMNSDPQLDMMPFGGPKWEITLSMKASARSSAFQVFFTSI